MRNNFNATCAKCGRTVLRLDGETNLNDHGRWVTVHAQCPPNAPQSYRAPSNLDGLAGREYDDEFYREYSMTQADFRDAVNPDEGDRG